MIDEPTLDEIWKRHPDLNSDADYERLIAKYRDNRRLWAAGAKPIKEPKAVKVKGPKGPPPSLSDLGL